MKKGYTSYVLTYRNDNPSVEGNYFPVTYQIPSEYPNYRDPKTGKVTTLRLVEGTDELDRNKQNQMIGAGEKWRKRKIIFERGALNVREEDSALRNYLDKLLESGVRDFKRLDPVKEMQDEMKMLELKDMAVEQVRKLSEAKGRELLRGIGFKNVGELSAEEVKYKLRIMAEDEPSVVLGKLKDKNTSVRAVVEEAIERGVILRDKRSFYFTRLDDGVPVKDDKIIGFGLKEGSDVEELLVDYLRKEDGKEYLSLIETKLKS